MQASLLIKLQLRSLGVLCLFCLMLGVKAHPQALSGTATPAPHASAREVRHAKQRLTRYFRQIEGQQTLLGIENKSMTTPSGDTRRVAEMAGKEPAFWGADFGFGRGAVNHRQAMTDEAIQQWRKGAVVSLMFHTCAPTGDEFCAWDDIGGKHPVHLSAAQWNELVTSGTALNKVWLDRLDELAGYFEQLQEAGVVVLFRPLHEMNQCVFWWACHKGSHGTAYLYELTHDYLTRTKGLRNILWVWNVQDFPSLPTDIALYRPRSSAFDIASLDVYEKSGFSDDKYQLLLNAAKGKPIAIAECRSYPTAETIRSQPRWLYFMLWPDFIEENREGALSLFAQPTVVTLDKMPGWQSRSSPAGALRGRIPATRQRMTLSTKYLNKEFVPNGEAPAAPDESP